MTRIAALTFAWLVVAGCGRGPTPATAAAPDPTVPDTTPAPDPADPTTPAASPPKQPPPPLQPITGGQWQQRVVEYEDRAAKLGRDPDAHVALGKWAFESGLEDEAWEQWLTAIAVDPDHAAARKATGFIADGKGGWTRPGTINDAWLDQVRADGRAFSFTIAIQDDADKAFFTDLSWRIRRMNWFLWRLTEGQVFLDKVRIEDKLEDGRFVIERGKLDMTLLRGGGAFCAFPGTKGWKVVSAGRVYVRILAHEMLHGIFGLPDERHGCSCIMQGGLYGIRTDQLALCDTGTHRPDPRTPTPCWDLARTAYPKLVHPNPSDHGRAPDIAFTIVDH